jgi:uncharacterized protein (DUF924 family)
MAQTIEYHELLDTWYSPRLRRRWFASTPELDAEIRRRFEALWHRAVAGTLDAWQETAEGALALAIVLDQLPLNMFRGQAAAFASEQQAVAVAKRAIARGFDQALPRDQVLSVQLFRTAQLADNLRFAEHHRGLIRRFGRFPHRNAILGRLSTTEELEYLAGAGAFKG